MTTSTSAPPLVSPDRQAAARVGLRRYFLVLGALSAVFMTAYGFTGQPAFGAVALVSPAAACVVARLVGREGFADVSFRFGGRRTIAALGVGIAIPLVVGTASYGLAWASGLARFDPLSGGGPLGTTLALPGSPGLTFLLQLAAAATVVAVPLALTALGEELGWRGYMLTRLVDAGLRRPVLVSGLIWAVWHLPLTFLVGYAAGPLLGVSAVVLTAQITAAGFVIARLRLATGSLWPAVVFHGWWNSVIQTAFDPATTGEGHALWVGESGLVTTAVLVAVAVLASRGSWTMRRRPESEPVRLPTA